MNFTRTPAPAVAHAGPFLVFMALMAVSGFVKTDIAGNPWWRMHPEQWAYPLQTAVCLGLVAWWWPSYKFGHIRARGMAFGALIGAVGIAVWLFPSWLHGQLGIVDDPEHIPWYRTAVGVVSRAEPGFDPTIWKDSPGVFWTVIVVRFLRMTVAVAFLEELFWRSFLWRTVADPYRDFHKVPIGQFSARALAATVPLFALAHTPPDYLAAIFWALGVSWVLVKTKSLGACVLCHAVSNFLLGVYIMRTGQWGLW